MPGRRQKQSFRRLARILPQVAAGRK